MKKSLLLFTVAAFMLSCSTDIDEFQCETTAPLTQKSSLTRSVSEDSTLSEKPTVLMETKELTDLMSIRNQRKKSMSYPYETDEFFQSNLANSYKIIGL